MTSPTLVILWISGFLLLTYLAGSVNFSILLFKILGRGDPRDQFSGNPGATNVKRQLGSAWAALVLLLDMARAVGVALLGLWLFPPVMAPLFGLGLIVGNRYPLFHGYRGGKGVAAYLGFTAAVFPAAAGVACLAWLAGFLAVRQPFIGSFFMIAVLAAGTIYRLGWSAPVISGVLLTLGLIVYGHRGNLAGFRKRSAR